MAITVAGDEPDTAVNIMQASTDAIGKPSLIQPILSIAKSTKRCAAPPFDKKEDVNIKNGMAIKV